MNTPSPILSLEWKKWQRRYLSFCALAFIGISITLAYLSNYQRKISLDKIANLVQAQLMQGNYRDAQSLLEKQIPKEADYVVLLKANQEIYRSGKDNIFLIRTTYDLPGEFKLVFYYSTSSALIFYLIITAIFIFISLYFMRKARQALENRLHAETQNALAESRALMAEQLAHDLRAPLGLLQQAKSADDPALFSAAMQRLENLASSMLSSTKKNERIDLGKICQDTTKLLQARFPDKSIQLENFSFPCLAPRADIERAITNLVKNSLEAATKNIEIKFFRHAEFASINICDDGPGLSTDQLKALENNEKFSTKKDGHGLGLQQAKQSLRSQGWNFEIKNSKPPKSSADNTCALAGAIQNIIIPLQAILIDDDLMLHKLWQISARRAGVTLHTYASFNEFTAAVSLFKPNSSTIPQLNPSKSYATPDPLNEISSQNPQPIIYIDSDLSPEGERGEILAKELRENHGFNNIILATAHNADRFPLTHFPWLRAVKDKTAPW